MADSSPNDKEIISVSEVPLLLRSVQVALLAIVIGLGVSAGIIYFNTNKAGPIAEVFRQSRKPILQYRLEKGAWPTNFSFDKAPVDLEQYDFSATVRAMHDLEVRGVWQFASEDVGGKTVPKVIFKPEDSSLNTRRILFAVDSQLDDGQENSGRLIVTGAQAEFTLMAE